MTNMEHLEKRRAELEAGNARSYSEMCQFVGQRIEMDTSNTRRELFYAKLVEWGIVSEEQALEFEVAFHEKIEEALNLQWAELRKHKNPNLTVVKQPTTLLGADGRPLT